MGMELLQRQVPYSGFLERVRNAAERVLLLDYDGTLAPFTPNRDHAFPYPQVPPLLARIMAQGTRVVLVTGRPARELVVVSGLYPHPEIWGSHGLERLTAEGTYHVQPLLPGHEAGLLAAADSITGPEFEGNVELKPGSIAIHWRGLPEPDVKRLRDKAVELWSPLVAEYSLKLLDFDGGVEIRTPNANKGNVVNSILGESGKDAAVAYLGDDQTDEDAFRALKGRGLSVLVRPEPRPTAADLWLKPPEELDEFLRQWLFACGGRE
jgi:trehalose-phosphatase